MLQNGMQVPIIVLREQGQHLLVSGHRRVDALQALRRQGGSRTETHGRSLQGHGALAAS